MFDSVATAETIATAILLPFVFLVAGGLSCLLFMGAKEIRRLGFVEGLPNCCGFVALWVVIETTCVLAFFGLLQDAEVYAHTQYVVAWISGGILVISIVLGLGWMAGKRIMMHASDWMMSGAFVDME